MSESFPAFGLRIPIELKTLVNSAAVPKIKSIADEITERWFCRQAIEGCSIDGKWPIVMDQTLPVPVRLPRVEIFVSVILAEITRLLGWHQLRWRQEEQ